MGMSMSFFLLLIQGNDTYTGADVMHPSPGSVAPSYAALVSSIDKLGAKYIAKSSMQTLRQEMISNLRDMAKVWQSYKSTNQSYSILLIGRNPGIYQR